MTTRMTIKTAAMAFTIITSLGTAAMAADATAPATAAKEAAKPAVTHMQTKTAVSAEARGVLSSDSLILDHVLLNKVEKLKTSDERTKFVEARQKELQNLPAEKREILVKNRDKWFEHQSSAKQGTFLMELQKTLSTLGLSKAETDGANK